MDIIRITTQDAFAYDATLRVWNFGPLGSLPRDAGDGEADEDDMVFLAQIDGATVGYLTADRAGVWCVEVDASQRGNGIARALVAASGATNFCEVCSADGVALAEALGMEYEEA